MSEERFSLGLEISEEVIYVERCRMNISAWVGVGRRQVGRIRIPCGLSILRDHEELHYSYFIYSGADIFQIRL